MPLHIEHIFPIAAGGSSAEENLWLACPICNGYKGTQTEAIDAATGQVVALFNPRQQRWDDHFHCSPSGTRIHFHVKVFRAKTPMRILGRKPERAHAEIGRRLEVASFLGNAVEGENGPAALLQLKIIILSQRHSGKNRKLDFGPAGRAKDEEKNRSGQNSRAGSKMAGP